MRSLRADLAAAAARSARSAAHAPPATTRACGSREQLHRADAAISEFRARCAATCARTWRAAASSRRRRSTSSSTELDRIARDVIARCAADPRVTARRRLRTGRLASRSGRPDLLVVGHRLAERHDEDRPVLAVRQPRGDRPVKNSRIDSPNPRLRVPTTRSLASTSSARCLIAIAGSPTSCRTLQSTPWPSSDGGGLRLHDREVALAGRDVRRRSGAECT